MNPANNENRSLPNKAFQAWQATMATRAKAMQESGIDWSKFKLDPSKLSVEMGPVLTEEQFQEYCKNTGINHKVIKTSPSQESPEK